MRWEDERYIRIFTRDTPTWDALGWEAQALLMLIFRKMDRTGLLALGASGMRGLSACVRMPADVVERALAVLIEDGVLSWSGRDLFCKNFLAAQDCPKSDSLRSKEKRERAQQRLAQEQEELTRKVSQMPRSDTSAPRSDTPSVPSVPNLPEESLSPRDPSATTTVHGAECVCAGSSFCLSPVLCEPTPKRYTGWELLQLFGATRIRVLAIQPPPGAGNPSDSNGKAGAIAASLSPEASADVLATMELFFKHVKAGEYDPKDATQPSFAFGSWISKFDALREEMHGCTPKVAPKPTGTNGRPAQRQVTYDRIT